MTPREEWVVNKYLARYAERESLWCQSSLDALDKRCWEHVVCIPACAEDQYLPVALQSVYDCTAVREGENVLVILVLNGTDTCAAAYHASNARTREWLCSNGQVIVEQLGPQDGCPQALIRWQKIDLLLINRSSPPWLLPPGHGVGLARKIAADVALRLIVEGAIRQPWIHSTDADVEVPANYLSAALIHAEKASGRGEVTSCCLYPYEHVPDMSMDAIRTGNSWPALVEYELWLRYYVAGLGWAGSRYAYPAIGSLPAINATSYAQVRGFPRLQAAEDFYLLNKLAKVGHILRIEGQPIRISGRDSQRVPFGTGQGSLRIEQLHEHGAMFEVYHPAVFAFLRIFLGATRDWFTSPGDQVDQWSEKLAERLLDLCPQSSLDAPVYSSWVRQWVQDIGLIDQLTSASRRARTAAGALEQFEYWFDAFKTLKLVHRLRDEVFGSMPLLDAMSAAEFMRSPDQPAATESWLGLARSDAAKADFVGD